MLRSLFVRLPAAVIAAIPLTLFIVLQSRHELRKWLADPVAAQKAQIQSLQHQSVIAIFVVLAVLSMLITLVVEAIAHLSGELGDQITN